MWFILPILSGLSVALWNTFSKKSVQRINRYWVTFGLTAFSLPFILISFLWFDLGPLNWTFWWSTVISAVLSLIGLLLIVKALQISDLSLAQPLLAFTPVFLILTSIPLLREKPSLLGFLGIILIVIGAYFLQLGQGKGVLGPIKALAKDQGARLMMIVALIYSVSSATNKVAVQSSNPITYILFAQLIMALLLLPMVFKSKEAFSSIKPNIKWLVLLGFLVSLELFFHMTALQLSLASYVISLKRTSVLFSIILGAIIFKEKNIKSRLVAGLIMLAGVIIISLS